MPRRSLVVPAGLAAAGVTAAVLVLSAMPAAGVGARPAVDAAAGPSLTASGGAAVAAVPGRWTPVYHSDMSDLRGWGLSDRPGRPKPQGPRLKSNVVQKTGFVRLESRLSTDPRMKPATQWASSGMALYGQARRFGRFHVRMRSNASYGTRNVALLWPQKGSGRWPCAGEIDFYEVSAKEPTRQHYNYSNHFCKADHSNAQNMAFGLTAPRGDFTGWHDFDLVWRPTEEILYIDGVRKAHITRNIPTGPMWLGLQTAQGKLRPGQTRTESRFDITDVTIYRES